MGRYLDPKADVVFKKIFGQHPHLLKSFLNAVLPLPEDGLIAELEYLPSEQIPEIPAFKRTIVDVKCKDISGRIFIVEMQVEWIDSFMQRLLFGTAQAYVKQLKPGETYHLLNPVYGLALVNSIFDTQTPDWYHHYGLVKLDNPAKEIIKGLSLVFVELPKFKATSVVDRKLKLLWLRFMREISGDTQEVDPALLEVPEIKEAIGLTQEAAFSAAELEAYDSYWKAVSSEKTLREASEVKGRVEGRIQGRMEGKIEGKAEGEMKATIKTAKKMKSDNLSIEIIAKYTGLSIAEIERL